jgi:mannitol/fructose-specific phosphotransferase system IIA component (Ntr-type)
MKNTARKIEPLPPELTGVTEPLSVARALQPRRVNLSLAATDKEGVLRELVTLIVPPQEKRPFDMLLKALKAREDLCPTCVNEGVAIPHSRNALIGVVDQATLAYGRHRTGVDFGAFDGQPIRHFFCNCWRGWRGC